MLAVIVNDDTVDNNLMIEMINKKKTLPNKSILKKIESSFDYVGSFGCKFFDKDTMTSFFQE